MLIFTNQEFFEIGENIYGTLYIKLDEEFPFKCSLRMTYKVDEKLSYTVEVAKKVGNNVKKKQQIWADSDEIYSYGLWLFTVPICLKAGFHTFRFTIKIQEDVPPSFAYDRKSDTAFVRHKLVAELFAVNKTFKHSLPLIVHENSDKFIPQNPYELNPDEYKLKKIWCSLGYRPAHLSWFIEKLCYKPNETIHINWLIKYFEQTPRIKEISWKLVQRVEFYLDVVKIKERVLMESFYALSVIHKEKRTKYSDKDDDEAAGLVDKFNLTLSLDLTKVEEHGASVNSFSYDLYHLAYTLPNSIDDPIIKCLYFVEVTLNYDTWFFTMDPTVLRVQVEILPKSIYDVKVIQEHNMKGPIDQESIQQ